MAGQLDVDQDLDIFKDAFKRYKRRQPPPDMRNVIDFRALLLDQSRNENIVDLSQSVIVDQKHKWKDRAKELGLNDPAHWLVLGMKSHPGFCMILNPFQEGGQHGWVNRCVMDYPCHPNKCNLDSGDDLPGDVISSVSGYSLSPKLRWVTMGYHYDWNTKLYCSDRYSPFPLELSELTSLILEVVGYPNFSAEAAIINYYHMDSTLSGHTDHSEFDLSSPLISMSFGQSAIFLLGGQTKAEEPIAMFLRSGDVIILAGDSRLSYHGVPKILSISNDEKSVNCLSPASLDTAVKAGLYSNYGMFGNWSNIYSYMQKSRINISVRQVFSKTS